MFSTFLKNVEIGIAVQVERVLREQYIPANHCRLWNAIAVFC